MKWVATKIGGMPSSSLQFTEVRGYSDVRQVSLSPEELAEVSLYE